MRETILLTLIVLATLAINLAAFAFGVWLIVIGLRAIGVL